MGLLMGCDGMDRILTVAMAILFNLVGCNENNNLAKEFWLVALILVWPTDKKSCQSFLRADLFFFSVCGRNRMC